MIRSVELHGRLKVFGVDPFKLDIASPGEAVRALSVLCPGFRDEMRKGSYHLIANNGGKVIEFDINDIQMNLGKSTEFHIVPAFEGCGKGMGAAKIVLGVALIAGAFFFAPAAIAGGMGATAIGGMGVGVTYGNIAMMGLALALSGVSTLLAPSKTKKKEDNSYTLTGTENTQDQGNPVPIVVGRFRCGSVIASVGISTEQIGTSGVGYPS